VLTRRNTLTTLALQAQPATDELLKRNEDQLYEELGARLISLRSNASIAGSFNPPTIEPLGPADDLRLFGQHFFARVGVEAYEVTCGGQVGDTEEHAQLLNAFTIGYGAVAAALAGVLVASMGLAPAIAAVVATIAVKICFRAAYGAMCEVWKQKVSEQNAS
jgi:hypothetical protein